MTRDFKKAGGWDDASIEKFIADSNSDEFNVLHDDISVSGEILTITLDDITEIPRLLELAAIAKNLGANIVSSS